MRMECGLASEWGGTRKIWNLVILWNRCAFAVNPSRRAGRHHDNICHETHRRLEKTSEINTKKKCSNFLCYSFVWRPLLGCRRSWGSDVISEFSRKFFRFWRIPGKNLVNPENLAKNRFFVKNQCFLKKWPKKWNLVKKSNVMAKKWSKISKKQPKKGGP